MVGGINTKSTGYYDPISDAGNAQTNTMLGWPTTTTPPPAPTANSCYPRRSHHRRALLSGQQLPPHRQPRQYRGHGGRQQHTQATYSYDPVGNTRSTSGPYPLLSNNPIRYAGGYQTTTGLIKFGARCYDPNTGRFTQPDPSGQETNPYTYAGDNATNYTDATGYLSLSGTLGTLGAVAGAGIGIALVATGCGAGVVCVAAAVATGAFYGAAGGATGAAIGGGSRSDIDDAGLYGLFGGLAAFFPSGPALTG